MKEKLELRKVREFGEIISDTFLFIKQNFKALMQAYFAICGLFIVAGILSMLLQRTQVQEVQQIGRWRLTQTVISWEYGLMMVLLLVNYVSTYVTVYSFIALYIRKGNVAPSLAETWSYFKYYFFRVFGSTIVMTIILILGFALCLIPGFYLFPAFTLFLPIMVLENGSFGHSFNRAFKLLNGEWWITAAVLFVIYLIFYMCSFIVQVPAFLIELIVGFTNVESGLRTFYMTITSCLTYLAQAFTIIPIAASALIYFNLVERKESTGLFDRMNTLGNQKPQEYGTEEEY
jgi:hypothetical protein